MELDKYKRLSFWPMNALAVIFLFVFCASNFHLEIAVENSRIFSIADNAIWLIFLFDYLMTIWLSQDRRLYFRSHLLQLVVVAVPFLRVFRIGLLLMLIVNALGTLKNRILVSVPVYTGVAAILFVLVGAASVYDAELQNQSANIKSREDAFWWAVVTIFTVGYGDRYPVTSEGRIYGVGLMICGIAIVGTVTATFASWLVGQIREVETENQALSKKLDQISEKLDKKYK